MCRVSHAVQYVYCAGMAVCLLFPMPEKPAGMENSPLLLCKYNFVVGVCNPKVGKLTAEKDCVRSGIILRWCNRAKECALLGMMANMCCLLPFGAYTCRKTSISGFCTFYVWVWRCLGPFIAWGHFDIAWQKYGIIMFLMKFYVVLVIWRCLRKCGLLLP